MVRIVLIVFLVLPVVAGFGMQSAGARGAVSQVSLVDYELIGAVNIATGTLFQGTVIGGLSSITYDPARKVYYAISDDQGTINPVRYYTLAIDVSDGQLDPGDINFLKVTTIFDPSGAPYAPTSLDPEGLVLAQQGQLYFSSEGFAARTPPVDPFINRMNLNGRHNRSLSIPEKFLPDGSGTEGVRSNLGFESLNVTPDHKTLVTAAEGALAQDGPAARPAQLRKARG
jgi:3-phytase/alkaline phosphatase D